MTVEEMRALRSQLEAERDAARIRMLNFSLPRYSLEVEAKQKQIDDLDVQLREAEAR